MTTKAYLEDASLSGNATVTATGVDESKGWHWVRLDRTLFHAQGGGQKADRGTIEGIAVEHVAHGPEGTVDHFVKDSSVFAVGQEVAMAVDADWRLTNARSHTAGHLIAALVERRWPAMQALSGHHWPGEARVEFGGDPKPDLDEVRTMLAADLEGAIAADLPVSIEGDPHSDRSIAIGDHPAVGCGGTHLANLAALGGVELQRIRSKSGKLRISYDLA